MNQPNLLFVFGDQWRAQALGYAGNPDVQTPNIDRFAGESLNVHRAVSGCPVCTPARASFLTGLYPDQHGLFLNDVPLDPGRWTLGKHLKQAGYDTAWVGKWHVDGHGRSTCIPPERRHGFETWQVLECTHDYNESDYYEGDDPNLRRWDGYDAAAQTDSLVNWLDGRQDASPFAAVLSWGPPHNPYWSAPSEYKEQYDPADLTVPVNVPSDIEAEVRKNLAGYYAHCSALDACFGQLLDTLERLGKAEDTLVIFTSDHGDFLGAHGLYDKQGPWAEAVRIPFLARLPGTLRPGTNDTLLDVVDWFPTLCGLLGIEGPAGLQGRDLSRCLIDRCIPEDNTAVYAAYHTFGNWPKFHDTVPALYHAREARGLLTTTHTYVEDRSGPWLLYDDRADPYQLKNLIDDPKEQERLNYLALELRRRLALKNDRFLPGADYVRQFDWEVDESGTAPIR